MKEGLLNSFANAIPRPNSIFVQPDIIYILDRAHGLHFFELSSMPALNWQHLFHSLVENGRADENYIGERSVCDCSGKQRAVRKRASLASFLPCPQLIEESGFFHLVEIACVHHFLRFDRLGSRIGGSDFVQG